ncbi:asparagine synthase (glutamine-hydrolyzing) [Thermodesulfovibrio yellowstonii]|uniref:asparagine synthase (glutamine-hydrolyzing) n=1 Tax=Thermodesulfovibrio yellowstonii TaxID=28262 RepID=A0A9W6GIC3_9BACT|nr:asparagine synthase (glutamine-hydrolyzing) [Thermodesulfovibrio islandicus]GLI54207.1 asparagine synthetase B [Thermodesulfovibrio islandicus]
MCGILGVFKNNYIDSLDVVMTMLDKIKHRGPDHQGIVFFNTKNKNYNTLKVLDRNIKINKNNFDLALGHVRLSIIDLSQMGNQPMQSIDGKTWIVYNGEIFNYIELRELLEKRGYKFISNSDTEVIINSYKEFGQNCVENFRGFFVFCIYDMERNLLFLARDRLGKKPLKYYWDREIFCFTSEIKSLLDLPWISKSINFEAIDQFLSLRYILPPNTIIKQIKKLPAGCTLSLSLNDPIKEPIINKYWTPKFQPKTEILYDEALIKSEQLLTESINIRLRADVPVGFFISGGLDSSLLLSLIKNNKHTIKTFTVGFTESNYDERYFANLLVKKFKTDHTEIIMDFDLKNEIEKIVWHYDEPFGDPSAIPSYYLCKAASEHLKVMISGDGGDELFAGYKRYYIHSRNNMILNKISNYSNIFKCLSQKMPFNWNKKAGWGKILRIFESLSGDLIHTYPLRFAGFSPRMRMNLYDNPDFLIRDSIWNNDILKILKDTEAKESMEKLMALDQITFLPEYILVKTDLASMSNSLEIRNPYLDHYFVDWINCLPLHFKKRKKLLRDIAKNKLPIEILSRKKAGFNPPIGRWLRVELRNYLDNYIFDNKTILNLFNKKALNEIINLHLSHNTNLGEPIWLLLVLSIWFELHKVKI